MLPNVEAQALPPLGELSAEILSPDGDRRAALTTAQQLDLPFWKRTDLGNFNLAALRPVFGTAEIETVPAGQGVYVADLQTALAERPEVVRKYWGKAVETDYNKFTALNAALARDGVVVHVSRNVEVAAPVRVRYRIPEGGVAIFPRTLVVAEANSRVTVIEE
jgi:Fe-S cluster assembly scaffold protein SufB